ncbi:unnamed protein product [Trichobilharzia szidati]|nr:unnamed protein product [Trichobilharzia szidati]
MLNSYLCFISLINLPYCLAQTDWDIRANIIIPSQPSSGGQEIVSKHNAENELKAWRKDKSEINDSRPSRETTEKQDASTDCLEAINNCESLSGICKVDVEIFKTFCGDWTDERNLLGCQRKYLRECQSALKTMNLGRPGLKQCTCDSRPSRSIDDLTRCNLLRRNLNKHPCLAEPPIFLREPQTSVNFRYDRKNEVRTEHSANTSKTMLNSNKVWINLTSQPNKTENLFKEEITTSSPDTSTNLSSTGFTETSLNKNYIDENPENPSCLYLLERCTKQPACTRALNKFRALCTMRTCDKLRLQCLEASRKFFQFKTHADCSCQSEINEDRYRRCLDYKQTVIDNQCVEISSGENLNPTNFNDLEYLSVSQNQERIPTNAPVLPVHQFTNPIKSDINSTYLTNEKLKAVTPPTDLTNNNVHKKVQSLIISPSTIVNEMWNNSRSCYSVLDECLHNPICVQHFINLRYACIEMNKEFSACRNPTQCINAIKSFYSESDNFVNTAISCTCEKTDSDCQKIREIFVPTCIRQSSEFRTDCYQAWIQCQNNAVCRTSYDFLVSECQNHHGHCSLNPVTCINSYRRLWTGSWAGGCKCELGEKKGRFSDNILSGCSEFSQILTRPPCTDHNVGLVQEVTNPLAKEEPLSCIVMDRLKTNAGDLLKLPMLNAHPENKHLNRDCSLLCSCRFGCRYEMCYAKETNKWHAYYLSNHTGNNITLPTRIETINIYRPNLSLACIYLPKLNHHCQCHSNNQVVCNVFNQPNHYAITGHKLQIDFDVEMYSTIIDLMADEKSLSEFEFYGSIVQLELLLTNFITYFTGQTTCRLILSAYQTVNGRNLWLKYRSGDERSSEFITRLEYSLVINSDHYIDKRNYTSFCINILEIVNIMINDEYPHIKYNPKFSTFLKSVLKAPIFNEYNNLNKNDDSLSKSQKSQRHQQQQQQHQQTQGWRHTRTSIQLQRNNNNKKVKKLTLADNSESVY